MRLSSTDPSLHSSGFDRRVGDDPALHQQLAAPPTAGLQPLLIEPEQVGVRRAGRALADFRQHIYEADELLAEFCVHRRERVALDAAERAVGAAADADVVV